MNCSRCWHTAILRCLCLCVWRADYEMLWFVPKEHTNLARSDAVSCMAKCDDVLFLNRSNQFDFEMTLICRWLNVPTSRRCNFSWKSNACALFAFKLWFDPAEPSKNSELTRENRFFQCRACEWNDVFWIARLTVNFLLFLRWQLKKF